VQLALTAAALAVTGTALTSSTSGVMVSTPVITCGLLLTVAAIVGLIALRRPSLYVRASIVLLAPLALAVASSLTASTGEDDASVQVLMAAGVWESFQETLRLLELASWLVLAAVVIATVSGLLLLQLKRRQARSTTAGPA
jgi:hypothetical protein